MPEFYFEVDRKIIAWQRLKWRVKAETQEQALAKVQESFEKLDFEPGSGFISDEVIYETIQPLSLSDNGEYATVTVQDEKGNIIYQNAQQI